VSWLDARAYSRWAGGRLPGEAEWEYAAGGSLDAARYLWGDELTRGGEHRMNDFQGRFPEIPVPRVVLLALPVRRPQYEHPRR
jgi:formylglycine-generating enzyme